MLDNLLQCKMVQHFLYPHSQHSLLTADKLSSQLQEHTRGQLLLELHKSMLLRLEQEAVAEAHLLVNKVRQWEAEAVAEALDRRLVGHILSRLNKHIP
jgi:hypothetical protein